MDKVKISDAVSDKVQAFPKVGDELSAYGYITVKCYDKDGNLRWEDEGFNLIVTTGVNAILDGGFGTATWYMGLTDNSPTPNAADTMASHAGWAETQNYTEATREVLSFSAASSGSKATSADAQFNIDTGGDAVGGIFISSSSTKGGTTGTLFSCAAFSGGNRALNASDVLNVGYTVTLTAS